MIRAWHFTNTTLRNGAPIPKPGEWLIWRKPLVMCLQGLHASVHPFDALQYAPGPFLHLVDCSGQILEGKNKIVVSRRRIVASMNATEMLRYFARMQALSVVHYWEAPNVVLDYLMTGEEKIRPAAESAARSAAWSATRSATRSAFNELVCECFRDFL